MNISVRKIAYAAVVGAAYAALTMLMAPISYGNLQIRLSEALCILPYFFPSTAWGLFVGCALANLMSTAGILDVIFGSLATLIACLITAWLGKRHGPKPLACLPPVVVNGVIIGAVLAWMFAPHEIFWESMLIFGLEVAGGEIIAMDAIGLPLLYLLPKARFFSIMRAFYAKG